MFKCGRPFELLCCGTETGGLFGLAIRLMQLFSENPANFTELTDILGLYFQIRDDYANLCMKEVSAGFIYFFLSLMPT